MMYYSFKFELYTHNETDCTASTVTITAKGARESDATVELNKRKKKQTNI